MSLFDFSYTPTKAIIALTSKFASELPRLQAVSLVLAYQHSLTDEELADLSSRLWLGIRNLKQISLTFCEISLNAAALKHIMSIPLNPKFKALETLSLNFFQCQFLSNKFITKLGENICQNLVKLKKLYLNLVPIPASYPILGGLKAFFDIEGISNKGLVQFGKILERRGMSNLELISLCIEQSPQISDVGVKKFCDKIEGIKGLERVFLKFRLCHKVTCKAKEYMEERFGNAKKGKLELI